MQNYRAAYDVLPMQGSGSGGPGDAGAQNYWVPEEIISKRSTSIIRAMWVEVRIESGQLKK